MGWLSFVVSCIYFYLPVAFANVGANLGRFIPPFKNLKSPLDFGAKLNGQRIIGSHKQLGSFLFGVLTGSLTGAIKTKYLDRYMLDFLMLNETGERLTSLYIVMSVAALAGDIIKSIIKRLLKRPPHSAWIPFDEIDHTLVSLLVAKIIYPISWSAIIAIILIFLFLHLIANILGYLVGIKKVPY